MLKISLKNLRTHLVTKRQSTKELKRDFLHSRVAFSAASCSSLFQMQIGKLRGKYHTCKVSSLRGNLLRC